MCDLHTFNIAYRIQAGLMILVSPSGLHRWHIHVLMLIPAYFAVYGGAVAGGYAGNEVEKNVKKHTLYKTTVKLDDGSVHEYTVSQQFAVGAKVNVSGKNLTPAN